MIEYKIDILKALKAKGYNTTVLRRDKHLGQSAMDALRYGQPVSMKTLGLVCDLLDCEPGDILVRRKAG